LPAVAGISGSLPEAAWAIAIIEVPTAGDRQEFRVPPKMEVRWIYRGESSTGAAHPGQLALEAVKTVPLTGPADLFSTDGQVATVPAQPALLAQLLLELALHVAGRNVLASVADNPPRSSSTASV
jgi:NADPH-dependent ferric siderophore reductase